MLRSYRRELEALKRYEHQRRLDELAIRIFALRDRYWPVRRRRPIRQALAAEQLDRALLGRATQDTSPMLRVRAYRAMASLYLLEGDFAAAEETVRRGLRLAHKHDELYDYFAAPFLSELAVVAAYQHDAFGLAEAMQGLQTLIRTYPGEEPLFSYGRLLYYTYALKRCSVCRLGPGQEGGQDVAEAAAAFWQGVPAAVRGMLIRYAIGLFFHLAQYHLYFGNPAQARSWVERLLQERELLRRRPALYNAALLLRTIVAVEEAAWEEVQSHMRSWQEFRREHPELRLSLEASVRRLVRRLQQRKPHDPAEEIVARWQPYAQELAEAPDNQTMRQFFDFPFWLRLYHQRLSAAPPHAGPAAHTLALEEAAAAYTPTPAGPAPRQEG
jgi:hypothetical protein